MQDLLKLVPENIQSSIQQFMGNTAQPAVHIEKRAIYPANAPKPLGPYSPGIFVGENGTGTLYLAGQIGLNPATGKIVDGGIKD